LTPRADQPRQDLASGAAGWLGDRVAAAILAAARALLAAAIDPAELLAMRHRGSTTIALPTSVTHVNASLGDRAHKSTRKL
jgi:hypothetical protein